jgi:hypothetical protein
MRAQTSISPLTFVKGDRLIGTRGWQLIYHMQDREENHEIDRGTAMSGNIDKKFHLFNQMNGNISCSKVAK